MTREISIIIMLTMTMMLMMLTYLELDVSKGVIVDEPVISNTMTLHLQSGLGPMQITLLIKILIIVIDSPHNPHHCCDNTYQSYTFAILIILIKHFNLPPLQQRFPSYRC